MKRLFSLLLAVMLVMALAVPASAAGLLINGKNDITFRPGSSYHATDLFGDGFKNMMPGGTARQTITIQADFGLFREDSIKVTLKGVAHDKTLHYSEKAEQQDGHDADPDTGRDETVASMKDFLSILNLKITNRNNGKVIFDDSADKIVNSVVLDQFRNKGSIKLDLVLTWEPTDRDNEFAHRVGEIDWEFIIEAYDDPSYDNPKTGDYIMIAVAVMAVSAVALVVILAAKRKKKQ